MRKRGPRRASGRGCKRRRGGGLKTVRTMFGEVRRFLHNDLGTRRRAGRGRFFARIITTAPEEVEGHTQSLLEEKRERGELEAAGEPGNGPDMKTRRWQIGNA